MSELSAAPLELHMSRSSPGRYALHNFAKNVFDVRITDERGHRLAQEAFVLLLARPEPLAVVVAREGPEKGQRFPGKDGGGHGCSAILRWRSSRVRAAYS